MILATMTEGNWIAILVPTGLAFLAALGTIIYRQGGLDKSVAGVERKIDKIDEKFDKYLLRNVMKSKSPLSLTDEGLKIFRRDKIQVFVKSSFEEIVQKMKDIPHESAYRAQDALFGVLVVYGKDSRYQSILENEAYETGQHIDILMKIIAIGIRDEVFSRIGMSTADIDATDPNKKDPPK
jgi:hypothetical protein